MHKNKIRKLLVRLMAFIPLTLLFSMSGYGATVLDQSFTPTNHYFLSSGDGVWQSFTAGATGSLSSIDVLGVKPPRIFAGSSDLIVKILDSSNNVLGSAQLSQAQIIAATGDTVVDAQQGWTGTFININYAANNIQMVAGNSYYISMNQEINWMGSYTGGYIGGSASFDPSWDQGFRTYVTTVPIPSAFWLFASGLVALFSKMTYPKFYMQDRVS